MTHKLTPLNDNLKHSSEDDDDDDDVDDYNSSNTTSIIDSCDIPSTLTQIVKDKKKTKNSSYHNNRYNLKNNKVPTAIMKNIVVGIMKNQAAKKSKIYDQKYNSIDTISFIEKNVRRFKLSKRAFNMIHEEAENYISDIFSVADDVKGKKLTLDLPSLKTAAKIHTKIVNSMK
jgi:hypothetical protein